jgi:SAM-dependent methyltransferase
VVQLPWRTPTHAALPEPFSPEYTELHRAFVTEALQAHGMLKRFSGSRKLPRAYGIGLDERVVEYPWALAQQPSGRVLDAGSTLNHAHILDRFIPLASNLTIVTLAPEAAAFTERGVSYVYADLRDLPFRDALFETIVSISTLEHVGMQNARYGDSGSPIDDPHTALRESVVELKRVLAPHGVLLVTVPYGVAEDYGWFRQFDRAAIEELVDMICPRALDLAVYGYSRRGWQVSSLKEAADRHYHDVNTRAARGEDLAAAARGVVCLRAQM